jgi:hypothetical protein
LHASEDENDIRTITLERNKKLAGLAEIESQDGVFVLVVAKPEETAGKVKNLLKLADDYRRPKPRKVNQKAVLRKVS